jgi:HTH-type transcriptional repressor of NAD biosynthesis genes
METKKFKHGITLGKFMPPHAGHMHLINEARKQVEKLTILVCSLEKEPIPGLLRFQWMQQLFPDPNVEIIHVTDEVPSYPHEHPDFWPIWTKLLNRYKRDNTQVFFAGEAYGQEVANRLNIVCVIIDRKKNKVSSSASAIRANPFKNWEFIPSVVRPYFVKRVVLTGPESTGKTTLCQKLAEHFQTNWVVEYGREHWANAKHPLTVADISVVGETQLKKEEEAAQLSNKILFCDTDLIVTQIWSEIYFKECPEWIVKHNEARNYDLYLLMDIDIPWVDDGTREFPQLREFHFNRLKAELEFRKLPFRIISGNYEERFERAVSIIQAQFSIDK